jgi:hypothetical protein
MLFYIGFGMQLIGFSTVGLCLFAGISKGDYGKMELIQLLSGALLFHIGQIIKVKGSGR